MSNIREQIENMPFAVVDLWSGIYLKTNRGHEDLNLIQNPHDGRYYGYCPPYGTLNIDKLGAKPSDDKVSGALIIYTTRKVNSSDREIIAFCPNATVHRNLQDGTPLNRYLDDKGKKVCCAYTVESDNLYEVLSKKKFPIEAFSAPKKNRFRRQRFYKGKYPELDKKIIQYISDFIEGKDSDEDFSFQEEIQEECAKQRKTITNSSKARPKYTNVSGSDAVAKDARISKQSLALANYKCQADESHSTFMTVHGNPYMEGHHLIPCTYNNSKHYWKTKHCNIDCEENIICLCPTCHRRIHFGSVAEKKAIIQKLYTLQKKKLARIGLDITLEELMKLYNL